MIVNINIEPCGDTEAAWTAYRQDVADAISDSSISIVAESDRTWQAEIFPQDEPLLAAYLAEVAAEHGQPPAQIKEH